MKVKTMLIIVKQDKVLTLSICFFFYLMFYLAECLIKLNL